MASYIGTSTSRIDGVAKVTGAAKYAGEFNVPGLAYGSVVTATIAKGRIKSIDRRCRHARQGRDRGVHARKPAAYARQ
jgi:xanthine dehydrogenase YagR molybdenum-binding subunit